MARWRANFEDDGKKLIKLITGFDEHEENFELCLQFMLSNFKYHKFLDVDSHKVTRALDGLHKKFLVHSQDEKAEAFKRLTEEFLDRTDIGKETFPKSDLHYGLLSVLIDLANSPTTAAYKEIPVEKVEDEEEDFDWAAYLREGEEAYAAVWNDSSPEWSEDEDISPASSDKEDFKAKLHLSPEQECEDLHVLPSCELLMSDEENVDEQSLSWLQRNVMVQYWSHNLDQSLLGRGHRSSWLVNDWESYLSSSNQLYITGSKTSVSEYQVMRETLWMLSGINKSFIYSWNDSHFSINPHVQLSHVTNETMLSLLSKLCHYGTVVCSLGHFVEEVAAAACSIVGDGMPSPNLTYEAYASSLTRYLQSFKRDIASLEKTVSMQEETITLSSLVEKLQPRFKELDVLHHIQQAGIKACDQVESLSQQSSHLLAVLYDTLLQCDTLGDSQSSMVSLLLPMWVQTSKPYLDIIDEWISKGYLRDPYKEFIIQRNESVKALDETFWDTAFTLHCASTTDSATKVEQVSEAKATTSDGRRLVRSKTKHGVEKSRSADATSNSGSTSSVNMTPENVSMATKWAPEFLTPVLEQIVLAGKSMEMLQNLGKLAQVVEQGKQKGDGNLTLYETFLKALEHQLGKTKGDHVTTGHQINVMDNTDDSLFTQNIALQMTVKGIQDPLLRINFEALFHAEGFYCQSLTAKEEENQRKLESLDLDHLHPVELLLEKCLYPHIRLQCNKVCSKLLQILKEDYNLIHYLTAIRNFLLLEAGDTMYDFYIELFEKLRLQEAWQEMSFLNLVLQECLHTHFASEAERLLVSIETPVTSRNKQPIHALDSLTLHYKVPWPVDVVLNSRCMSIYNQVFRFLMQIKRTKYCLDELRFIDLSKEDMLKKCSPESMLNLQSGSDDITRNKLIHRMQLFRMRLLHFVNSLHNYIMTRILHTTGLEFQQELCEAQNLDQVIATHVRYVNRIHERCVLHRNVAILHNVVIKVLNLALDFQACWDGGADGISSKTLCEMEEEFSRCITFLSSFLNNVIKKGSHPHLESLAFALVTSSEQSRTPAGQ